MCNRCDAEARMGLDWYISRNELDLKTWISHGAGCDSRAIGPVSQRVPI